MRDSEGGELPGLNLGFRQRTDCLPIPIGLWWRTVERNFVHEKKRPGGYDQACVCDGPAIE